VLAARSREPTLAPAERGALLTRAKLLLEQASALDPDDAAVFHELGRVHADLDDRPAARAAFSRALELKPDHEKARQALAALPP
jgi:lipoprotein NlpI